MHRPIPPENSQPPDGTPEEEPGAHSSELRSHELARSLPGAAEFQGLEDIFVRYVEAFLVEAPHYLERLRQYHGVGDLEKLVHNAHRFKGSCSFLRITALSASSLDLEMAARAGQLEACGTHLAKIQAELAKLDALFHS